MSFTVTLDDILSLQADAAVLPLEMTGTPTEGKAALRLAQAGGEALGEALRKLRFLAVGSAAVLDVPELPFSNLIVTAVPRWLTGKANELLVLHRCYESVYALAEELGCRKLVSPFLSCCYFHFPQDDAVHIALQSAKQWTGEAVFAADTAELYAISQKPWRKPQIVSYVGYYRDQAIFALDNGLYARVDRRPELHRADTIPYVEACYRAGTDPRQAPLPETEILRLRRIWDEAGI